MSRPSSSMRHHRKLRYHLVAVARKRNVGVHGVFGDNHACGMRRCVARHALERTRRINKLFDLRLLVVHLFQLRVDGQRLVDRNVQLVRHLLGNRVNIVVRNVERTADIADGTAGSHRAERDNLRHAVFAVLACNILDDLRTTSHSRSPRRYPACRHAPDSKIARSTANSESGQDR